jgi:hypothetical protein
MEFQPMPTGKIVITHVGISTLKNTEGRSETLQAQMAALVTLANQGGDPKDYLPQTQAASARLAMELAAIWADPSRDPNTQRNCSPAEVATLSRLDLQAGDEVVLVTTDTDIGRLAGDILYHVLPHVPLAAAPFTPDPGYGIYLPPPHTIRGLGIGAASESATLPAGTADYFTTVLGVYQRARISDRQLIFNTTGGVKGIITLATLVTTLLEATDRYPSDHPQAGEPRVACLMCSLPGRNSSLVTQRPLPLILDRTALVRYYPILAEAATEHGTSNADALALDDYNRGIYLTPPRNESGRWGLSVMGRLIWDLTRLLEPGR